MDRHGVDRHEARITSAFDVTTPVSPATDDRSGRVLRVGAACALLVLGLQPLAGGVWSVAVSAALVAAVIAAIAARLSEPALLDAALVIGLVWLIGLVPSIGAWPVGAGLALLLVTLVAWRQGRLVTWRSWFRVGKLDRWTWVLCGLTAVVSVAGLLLWQHAFNGTLPPFYVAAARSVSPWAAGLGGFAFLVLNGVVEDVVFFGLLLTASTRALGRGAIPLVAFTFGAAHLNGVPNGVPGVLMASTWGLILAYLRHRTGGMLATYLAHVIADATIVITLLPAALSP